MNFKRHFLTNLNEKDTRKILKKDISQKPILFSDPIYFEDIFHTQREM